MPTFENGTSLATVRSRLNTAIIDAELGRGSITTVAALIADTSMGYTTAAARYVTAGQRLTIAGFNYEVAASGASDHHVTTAGGVKLYVLPGVTLPYYARALDVDPSASDNTAALQKWADLGGGQLPAGTIAFSGTVEIPDKCQVIGQGAGKTILRPASGITGLDVSSTTDGTEAADLGTRLQGFTLKPVGTHANTIGIHLRHPSGTGAIANASIRDVSILGDGTAPSIGDLTGTGLKLTFCMKSVLDGLLIQNWGAGLVLEDDPVLGVSGRSNANDIRGCKIRSNLIAVEIDGDDNSISACTLEANGTSLKNTAGKLHVFGNHFESLLGLARNVHVVSGSVTSVGNIYSEGGADTDIFCDSTFSGQFVSIGDTLNSGVKNTGTGDITVINPVLSLITSGAGRVYLTDQSGIKLVQGSASAATFSGHSYYDFRSQVRNGGARLELKGDGGVSVVNASNLEMARFDDSKSLIMVQNGGAIRLTSPDGAQVLYLRLSNAGALELVSSV